MHNPVNTAISFVLLLGTVGASFAYVSDNPVEVPKEPWLGISIANITPAIAQELGLEEARGILIVEVEPGSPAAMAGLKGADRVTEIEGRQIGLGGDVVSQIDNTPIANAEDLSRIFDQKEIGDTIEFTVIREGTTGRLDIVVTIGEA